jgi:nitrate reductase assembly molybdenum cofactor insertion protein NarJ
MLQTLRPGEHLRRVAAVSDITIALNDCFEQKNNQYKHNFASLDGLIDVNVHPSIYLRWIAGSVGLGGICEFSNQADL